MRGILLAVWLLVPVLAGAYHYGPGQTRMELDQAQSHLAAARQARDDGQHDKAVKEFTAALEHIPAIRAGEIQGIRVERAKAMLQSGDLPKAYDELFTLLEEFQTTETGDGASATDAASKPVDPALLADAREAFASARYYLTWLMRLEGEPREIWEPEIEGSRQLYRLLAEESEGNAEDQARHQDDLEAAIRLARMDLSDLQALPLPSQCKGCCSGNCQCKGGKKPGKGKGRSQNKPKGDEAARGASSGPPPDDGGN
jgi:tetratricopeptide (TPR) repeat protein